MKKLLYAVVVLGWVPTLAIVTGARWMAGEPLLAQGRTPIKVTRIYTGPDGKTKAEGHPAPRRQYVVTLAGEREIELEGGRKLRLGPGSILLAEDTTGQGHVLRHVGSQDAISLTIPLADAAKLPR